MCDVDLTARLVSSHLPFLHANLKWNSGGVRKGAQLPPEQLMQKKKNLDGGFSFIGVHGNFWRYLWHWFHLSADTTLCVRCLAKGWFSTGSRNTSLLQYQYHLVFTLQQTQNKLLKAGGSSAVAALPEQGRVSIACPEQLSWFSGDWTINALERDWRPVVSKLLPLMQVSSQELHSDHSVRWQSPACWKNKSEVFKRNQP